MADGWDYHIEQALEAAAALRSNKAYQARYLVDNQDAQWLDWYDIGDAFIQEHNDAIILVHPGSGKSTLFSYMNTLKGICKDRTDRWAYMGKTGKKSSKFMYAVGQELKTNQRIKNDFGPFYKHNSNDYPWNTEQIRVIGSNLSNKTPTLINFGVDTDVEGFRFDHIVIDDPGDIHTAKSAAKTNQLLDTMETLIGRMDLDATFLFITHLFLKNDFVEVIMEKMPHIKVLKLPAIHAPGDIYTPDDNGVVLASKIWPGDSLIKQKKERHARWIWDCWYQQIPSTPEDSTFAQIPMQFSPVQGGGPFYSAGDPAYSTSSNSDYSVVMAGCKLGRALLVTDIADWRIDSGWSTKFLNFALRNGCRAFQVEINNAQTLGEEMRQDAKRQGLPIKVLDLRSKGKKEFRIGELADKAIDERILFAEHLRPVPAFKRLVFEWDAYPNIAHDDHLDTLDMLWRLVMGDGGGYRPSARSAAI